MDRIEIKQPKSVQAVTLKLKSKRAKSLEKPLKVHRNPSSEVKKRSSYNALTDGYACSYFQSATVQKHLKHMIKVFISQSRIQAVEAMPKNHQNTSLILSMQSTILRKDNPSANLDVPLRPHLYSLNLSQNGRQISAINIDLKDKKSPYLAPYRPLQLLKDKTTKSQINYLSSVDSSKCLPQIQKDRQYQGSGQKRYGGSFRSKETGIIIDRLHKHRHREFMSFLDKKRDEVNQKIKFKTSLSQY